MKPNDFGDRLLAWLTPPALQSLRRVWRYGLAVVIVLTATALRRELLPWLGPTSPYNLVVAGVIVATVLLGSGPGLVALILSIPAVEVLVVGTRPGMVTGATLVRMGVATLVGGFAVGVFHAYQIVQARLVKSQTRLATLAGATFEGVVECEGGRIVDCNEQFAQMTGRTVAELKGLDVAELIPPGEREQVLANIEANRESAVELVMLGPNGTRLVVETRGRPLLPENRRRQTVVRDITERKKAEQVLCEKNERLRLLSEAAESLLCTGVPEVSMRHLFERLAPQLDLDVYFNFLADKPGKALRLDSSAGVSEEVAQGMGQLQIGQAVSGTVAQERRAMVVKDVQKLRDEKTALIRGLGSQSYACFPLLAGEHLLGTLSFGSRQRQEFSPEDVELLQALSCYVAVAQEQAWCRRDLVRAVEERTAELRVVVAELEHFSYSITHDLKAPLRAMRGFAEIAGRVCADSVPEEAQEALAKISISAERMDRLITDALNYSRSARQELPLTSVDTGALLRGMLDTYPGLEPSRAYIQVEGKLPVVRGNEAALTQCLSNLLENAVKFVRPGQKPRIRVWAQEWDGWARICVEDKGIGISREMLPRVFDMFSRGSKSYEGTGIGLALVRKMTQRMGGTIGVESEEGQGSHFWLKLKLGEAPSKPETMGVAPTEPMGGTVLYVEDEESDILFMKRAFVDQGMESALRVVEDGRSAIEYLSGVGNYVDRKEYPLPSVMLLDLNLPQVPGFGVLEWMRNHPDFAHTPVVVFSSSTREDDRERALELGANDFVGKPNSGLEFGHVVEGLKKRWIRKAHAPTSVRTESKDACPLEDQIPTVAQLAAGLKS